MVTVAFAIRVDAVGAVSDTVPESVSGGTLSDCKGPLAVKDTAGIHARSRSHCRMYASVTENEFREWTGRAGGLGLPPGPGQGGERLTAADAARRRRRRRIQ